MTELEDVAAGKCGLLWQPSWPTKKKNRWPPDDAELIRAITRAIQVFQKKWGLRPECVWLNTKHKHPGPQLESVAGCSIQYAPTVPPYQLYMTRVPREIPEEPEGKDV